MKSTVICIKRIHFYCIVIWVNRLKKRFMMNCHFLRFRRLEIKWFFLLLPFSRHLRLLGCKRVCLHPFINVIFCIMLEERISAMDKALAWHTGSRGSNLDTTKVFSAPILSVTTAMCTLSHNACYHVLQCEYLLQGVGSKSEESW